eukprot:TRINITY_DN3212_c0_g1_i1.p1 TRINITY_DN3212_c0_g1~~TRINITY_DN3212_c0_g1_i1.p1  ORF type:complete len:355 (-),score=143.14 TRINITY_DN3212_c0_g1_i1:24-1088(-)
MAIVKRDVKREGWEQSDFPILCATCLGDNPYIRMTKNEFGQECKICARPFTVFRWKPGAKARFKKTEICQTCSKLKNVCQVCLLDLEFGLPVQVRDSTLGICDPVPVSDVNREWLAELNEKKLLSGLENDNIGKSAPNPILTKLARTAPYYKRNRAHVCSFFVAGKCTRGDDCPYRHEMPQDGDLAHQNIKDRYHGVNDPVAKKLLAKVDGFKKAPSPPEDKNITTLFVGNVIPPINEDEIRQAFYSYGEIRNIKMILTNKCSFITYTTREAAETAMETLFGRLSICGLPLYLLWAKPTQPAQIISVPPPPGLSPANIAPPPGLVIQNNFAIYPSMDPNRMGSRVETSSLQSNQ